MVEGLNLSNSLLLVPVTMFFYLTAILNPIIILKCTGPNCRVKMRSEFDDDFGDYDSYDDWRNGTVSLQSDGNVTLIRFKHGFVRCDSDCDDCGWKDDTPETCDDYDDIAYNTLLDDLETYNETLPSYLNPNCSCRHWCDNCDADELVSLPGDEDDGYHRHMQDYWYVLKWNCDGWEEEFGTDDGELCNLFRTFNFTMTLTVIAFVWLGAVLALMLFMEYTNFHIFNNGKCKCCFISTFWKKVLFTVLLMAPVSFMLIVWMMLVYGNTEEMLDKYFDVVGAEFEYDWMTRGCVMFWISIGFGILSIVAMISAGTTTRHLRTVIDYRRGVEYSGVNWKPHMS